MELSAISIVDSMKELLFCKLLAFSGILDSCAFGRRNPAMEWHFQKGNTTGTTIKDKSVI